MAASVRKVAAKLKQPSVRIGFFSPFGINDSHAGAAFMAELAATLEGFVDPKANLELVGRYSFDEDPTKPGLKVIVVTAMLIRPGK